MSINVLATYGHFRLCMAYTIDNFECFIYHFPLDLEQLHVQVAYLERSEDDISIIELREKMIHVPFGCMVLFPAYLYT